LVTPSEDLVTPSEDLVTPSEDLVIPSEDSFIASEDSFIASEDLITASKDPVTRTKATFTRTREPFTPNEFTVFLGKKITPSDLNKKNHRHIETILHPIQLHTQRFIRFSSKFPKSFAGKPSAICPETRRQHRRNQRITA
jgi:hypothetical protein